MFFNWKNDSINPIQDVFKPIARNDIEALLIEIRVRYEISLAIPWLVGILESKKTDVERQQSYIRELEQELRPIKQKIGKVSNQLERHRSVNVAVSAGNVSLDEFPDVKDGLKIRQLEVEKKKLEFDSEELEKLISEAYGALRIEQREFETGNLHMRTLNDYQNRPLPDSDWLVDWIKANVSDESN